MKTLNTYNWWHSKSTNEGVKSSEFKLGKVPNFGPKDLSHSKKCNRYLNWQSKRIVNLISKGEIEKAVWVTLCLLKNSLSYQLALFNKVRPWWYWKLSKDESLEQFRKARRRLNTFDLNFTLRRFYVIKNKEDPHRNGMKFTETVRLMEGEKLRPIGSPDTHTSMVTKCFNDLIMLLFEGERSEMQHAYRPSHGVHTVIMRIIRRYLENENQTVIEYDFRSYFNTVSLTWIYMKLYEKSVNLGNLICTLIIRTEYIFKDLVRERELRPFGEIPWRKRFKPLIIREGLPQGLSISPLLATLAQENIPPHEGNSAYADDGIFISEDTEDFYTYMESLLSYGVTIAPEKTRVIDKMKEIKFCGFFINFGKKYVRVKETKVEFRDPFMENFLKQASGHYGKKPSMIGWDINEGSMLREVRIDRKNIGWKRILKILIGEAMGKNRDPIKYKYGFGFYNILESSSECCNLLLGTHRGKVSKLKRSIIIPTYDDEKISDLDKWCYKEWYYRNEYIEPYNIMRDDNEYIVDMERKYFWAKVKRGKVSNWSDIL